MTPVHSKRSFPAQAVLFYPVVIDVLHFVFFDKINAWMNNLFTTPAQSSFFIIAGLYLGLVAAQVLLNLLIPDVPVKDLDITWKETSVTGHSEKHSVKATWPQILFFYPTVGFFVIVFLLLLHASGLVTDKQVFTDDQLGFYLTAAVLVLGGQLVLFANPIRPRYRPDEWPYSLILIAVLILSAALVSLSVAGWTYLFGNPAVPVLTHRPGKLADMFIAYPLFLLFFSSPRFMSLSRNFSWQGLLTGLILIGYFVWRSLDYVRIF